MPDAIETGEASPPKKKSPLKWVLLVVLLLVLGGGGYYAYTEFFAGAQDETAQGSDAEGQGTQQEGQQSTGDSQVVSLSPFLVNLADPLGRRYLKLEVDVEVVDEDAAETLQASEPKVRDALIMLLSSKTFSELSSMESKILLKKEIVERLNLVLGGSKVRQVYFTEMVIQ